MGFNFVRYFESFEIEVINKKKIRLIGYMFFNKVSMI